MAMLGDDLAKAADCILSRRGGGAPSPAGLRRRCSDANGRRAPACSVVVVANEEYAVVRGGRVVESGGVRVVESGRQEFRQAAAQLEWRPASVTNEWKRRRLETEKTKKQMGLGIDLPGGFPYICFTSQMVWWEGLCVKKTYHRWMAI